MAIFVRLADIVPILRTIIYWLWLVMRLSMYTEYPGYGYRHIKIRFDDEVKYQMVGNVSAPEKMALTMLCLSVAALLSSDTGRSNHLGLVGSRLRCGRVWWRMELMLCTWRVYRIVFSLRLMWLFHVPIREG